MACNRLPIRVHAGMHASHAAAVPCLRASKQACLPDRTYDARAGMVGHHSANMAPKPSSPYSLRSRLDLGDGGGSGAYAGGSKAPVASIKGSDVGAAEALSTPASCPLGRMVRALQRGRQASGEETKRIGQRESDCSKAGGLEDAALTGRLSVCTRPCNLQQAWREHGADGYPTCRCRPV